jgi:chromosome segregation ATPase
MRDVPLDDTSGKLQELQKQYSENNVKLKAFDASIGNSQRNVGNYKTALTGIEEGLSGLASAIAVGQGPLGPLSGRINAAATMLRKFTQSSGDAKDEVKKITTATKVYNAITLKVTIPTLTAQAAG